MEKLNSEDGQLFIKNIAAFIRTHEKALANALLLKRQSPSKSSSQNVSSLAAALSFGPLRLTSQHVRPAKLTLTPHHLFYLLSRFDYLSVAVGPMNVRLENIQTETLPSYVSFLNKPSRSRSDRDSIHSVSSVRSVISNVSAVWSSLGWPSSFSSSSKDSSKSEKAKAAIESDLKYLYSAFTKIPCLRLAPDNRARLIRGYEEFPFDTAVPLHAFKNLSSLDVVDIDFRSLFGWDRLADQLRTLTLKRANVNDPADLLSGIVLDDMDKRRRRSSSKATATHPSPPSPAWDGRPNSISVPASPLADPSPFAASTSPQAPPPPPMLRVRSEGAKLGRPRTGSFSPTRPSSSKQQQSGHHRHHTNRGPGVSPPPPSSSRIRRTGSASSYSSDNYGGSRNNDNNNNNNGSSSNLLSDFLPPSKWRFLQHLGLPENSLASLSASCLAPVANTLQSIDLSSNLFNEVPDSLASLVALRAVNLSNCMIESLHSLSRNPLPAIAALNLRGNRLRSIAGIERLLSLEKLDLRNNLLSDPTEIARLTGLPEIREVWVSGNPFVKTHPGYRVAIFNLFRRTPGYSEDIIIDGSGPGYAERKQLVDRAAEPEGAPVVRPAFPDVPTVVNNNNSSNKPSGGSSQPMEATVTRSNPAGPAGQGEQGQGSSMHQPSDTTIQLRRSKKDRSCQPKVVDTSLGDYDGPDDYDISPTTVSPMQQSMKKLGYPPFHHNNPRHHHQTSDSPQGEVDHDSSQVVIYRARGTGKLYQNAGFPGQQMKQDRLFQPTLPNIDFDVEGELYRRKLEALKNGVNGTGWLTVLGDQSWEKPQKDLSTTATTTAALHCSSSTLAPPRIQTNCLTGPGNSQVILSGGPI